MNNAHRYLEIGPGDARIIGFETLNTIKTRTTDYVGDINDKLPFTSNQFNLVYASHVIEHVFWYKISNVFSEFYRVLAPGGALEIWVPNGLKIAKAFVDAELSNSQDYKLHDGWFRFNPAQDPCVWFNGRTYSYGDGYGTRGHHNIHLTAFSERYLTELFIKAGFKDVRRLTSSECRGEDHGWINLGIRGTK